jgi:O-antigen/teichoic acid export membrane protein
VLLVLGNGAMAAIPWAVARYIAVENRPAARAEAMRFGLRASAIQALAAALLAGVVLTAVSGPAVACMTALAAALMSLVAGPVGYLQGTDRVPALARFRLLEAAVRIGLGLVVVLLISRGPAFSLGCFAVAGLVMFVITVRSCRDAWPLSKPDAGAARELVRQSFWLGSVQVLMCMLAAVDTVAVEAAGFPSGVTGGYQAAALLGRVPLFISTALSIAAYTEMARSPGDAATGKHLRHMLRFYALVTVPILLACWAVPHSVLSLLIPDSYSSAGRLLKYTSVSGAAIGLVNCLTTAHQARGHFRSCLLILGPAALTQPVLLIALGRSSGVDAFCIGLVSLSVATAVAIGWDARRWLRRSLPGPQAGLAQSSFAQSRSG